MFTLTRNDEDKDAVIYIASLFINLYQQCLEPTTASFDIVRFNTYLDIDRASFYPLEKEEILQYVKHLERCISDGKAKKDKEKSQENKNGNKNSRR